MTSTHDTRRRSTAAVVALVAVALAPALTPAALAYDAEAGRPDASAARFVLPNLDTLDGGGIDPFGDNLIPRRAMERPQEGEGVWVAIGLALCSYAGSWGLGVACGAAGVGYAIYVADDPFPNAKSHEEMCEQSRTDPNYQHHDVDGC